MMMRFVVIPLLLALVDTKSVSVIAFQQQKHALISQRGGGGVVKNFGIVISGAPNVVASSSSYSSQHHETTTSSAELGLFGRLFRSTAESDTIAVSEGQVRGLFYLWNEALSTGDSRFVAARYAKDAVLLPTVSDVPRTTSALIKDYFDSFLLKKPQGIIVDGKIKIGKNGGWAQDAGIYEFTMGIDGSKVLARYSFIYVFEDGQWKISHHHSSVMPEGISLGQTITEEQVRNWFNLWNDALATFDSAIVAQRYSQNPVLLPTVSDIPRTNYDSIKDYFDTFLLKKPQGKILESNVMMGTNWANDAGIYEFTMGIDGTKVKARYSFTYVYENGTWKISHHHSSMMPENIITTKQQITQNEVRSLFDLWNDALATGDSDKVAKRYSKEAVLLPTVSDTPRTNYELIKDYFDSFLLKQPQGMITDGNIIIGTNWAQDAGIYEFTMGVDGSKVIARYSFIYVYEDNEWKISHHHSSVMPEAFLGPAPKPNIAAVVNVNGGGGEPAVPV